MAESFLKRGKDTLTNGLFIGLGLGLAIVYGPQIFNFIVPIIPESWKVFGKYSVEIIIIGISTLVGYLLDKY